MTGVILQPTPPQILELIDRMYRDPLRRSELGSGWNLYQAAVREQLTPEGDIDAVARCVGELVEDGLVAFRMSTGQSPPGAMWGSQELQQHHEYRPTAAGQAAASRTRAEQIATRHAAVLEGKLHLADHRGLDPGARAALQQHAVALEQALATSPAAAVGAAKDLVEAACKVVLTASGSTPRRRANLPELFKQAAAASPAVQGAAPDVAGARTMIRSLLAAVHGLAEMRNTAGAGHGRDEPSAADDQHARLAAGIAVALAEWLLAERGLPL
jgi:hypothetical protein